MTSKGVMTPWRQVLIGVLILWIVLLAAWFLRAPPDGSAVDWLTIAVVLLPLLLVNEVWGMLSRAMRRRLRDREGGDA